MKNVPFGFSNMDVIGDFSMSHIVEQRCGNQVTMNWRMIGGEQIDITSVDNSWEKFFCEAEVGDRSLFTWRVSDRRRYFF